MSLLNAIEAILHKTVILYLLILPLLGTKAHGQMQKEPADLNYNWWLHYVVKPLMHYIQLADGLPSTTYGWGEWNCGDIGKPRPCEKGAITASGEPFDPTLRTAAVFAPTQLTMMPVMVGLKTKDGPCVSVKVNDKGNPRYIGERGYDVTPATLAALLGKSGHRNWSGRLYLCTP